VSNDGSVTRWLDGLKAGDDADIHRLWDRYFRQLVAVAGRRLPGHARREYDEEDVALSAFHSFCDRVGRGQFPDVSGRDDLWRLLVVITARKAIMTVRHQTRKKRGGGRVFGESVFLDGPDADTPGLAQFLGREPTPDFAAQIAEGVDHMLAALDDEVLRTIALMKLEGYSSEEIAARLGTSKRTVDRKVQLIRMTWQEESPG
jgi:DNA-directed RNA polymerase specialized sigma24 family protein